MPPLNPQQRLDATGVLELPPGTTRLDLPLFLDRSGAAVVGRPDALLDATPAGTAFVAGWDRRAGGSPLSAAHWDGVKFRTRVGGVDACLYGTGTPWDMGPRDRWPAVTRLTVTAKATLHNPATWHSVPLGGINGYGWGMGFGPHPRPWLMYWEGASLKFGITTADGVEWFFTVAGPDPANPQLRVRVTVDLNAGTVTADDLAGTTHAVTGDPPPPGSRLIDNDLFPFSFGRLTTDFGSAGPDGQWPDMTVEQVRVETYSPAWTDLHTADSGRSVIRVPYPGADPLPLYGTKCEQVAGGSPVWLMVLRRATHYGPELIRVEGVDAQGVAGNPNLVLGTVAGGLTLAGCRLRVGSRGISHARATSVAYPLTVRDCDLVGHDDCGLFLHGVPDLRVRDSQVRYAKRRCGVFVQCENAVVSNVFMAPGSAAREFVFDQRGGRVAYERCLFNAEGGPGPGAFLRVVGESWDQPWFATGARVTDCSGGYVAAGHGPLNRMALVRVDPRRPGYVPGTGPDAWRTCAYRVVVDQTDTADTHLTGAGLSDPTVSVTVNGVAHAGGA